MSKFDILDLCLDLMKSFGEEFSTSATLFVNGSVISGDLIHPMVYFRGVADILETSSGEISRRLGKTFRESVEKAAKTPIQPEEEGNTVEPDVIYLKNITLWNAPNTMVIERSFLVLRIDSIDGFIWGSASHN